MKFTYETLAKEHKPKVLICLKCGDMKTQCNCDLIVKLLQSQLEKVNESQKECGFLKEDIFVKRMKKNAM